MKRIQIVLWLALLLGMITAGGGIAKSPYLIDTRHSRARLNTLRLTESEPGSPVLARVDFQHWSQIIELPVYAWLIDGAGAEYVLVISEVARLEQSGLPFQVLDTDAAGARYAVLQLPSPARPVAQLAEALYADTRLAIARLPDDERNALDGWAATGYEVDLLPVEPIQLGSPQPSQWPQGISYEPAIARMIDRVEQSTINTLTAELSGEQAIQVDGAAYTLSTRYTYSGTPIKKATKFAYDYLSNRGLNASYHYWHSGGEIRNVVAEKTGLSHPQQIVLICAHIDDVPSSGRAPGADDNASGSVAVLLAADILRGYGFERTLRFVLFTGEEQGMLGSEEYADLVDDNNENIVAVLNLDMIAWEDVGGPVMRLHTRTTSHPQQADDEEIAQVFVDVVDLYGMSGALTPIITRDAESFSDHSSFWNEGYPAVLAIEDDYNDFNNYYHTSNDRLSALAMNYYTKFVKSAIGSLAHMAVYVPPGVFLPVVLDGGD